MSIGVRVCCATHGADRVVNFGHRVGLAQERRKLGLRGR